MIADDVTFGLPDVALLCLLWVLIVAAVATSDISGVVSWIAKTLNVFELNVSYLTLIPLRIEDFRATISLPKQAIYATISWSYFAVIIQSDQLTGADEKRLITVQVDDFSVYIKGVTFEDISSVSQKKLNEAKRKIILTEKTIQNNYFVCLLASVIGFRVSKIDMTFLLADPKGLLIRLEAIDLNCYCDWRDRSRRVLACRMEASCGSVNAYSYSTMIVKLWTDRLDLMVEILSKKLHMCVKAIFGEKNFVEINIQPFLVVFGQYQKAEDDAIEVKELHGMSSAGKMQLMSVMFPHDVQLCLTDERLPVPLVMELGAVNATIASDKPWFDDAKIVKTITASVASVVFIGLHSTVTGINAEIVKTVNNTGEHIDHEHMTVDVKDVDIKFVQPLFLAWLCALQETSNKIPSSRFAHIKTSVMVATVDTLYVSVQSSALTDSPIAMDPASGGWRTSSLPQSDPVEIFSFENMTVNKRQSAGSTLSKFAMAFDRLHVEHGFLAIDLKRKYNIDLHTPVSHFAGRCGIIFGFALVNIEFDLADSLDIKRLSSDLFTLSHSEFTASSGVCHPGTESGDKSFARCFALDVTCPNPEQFDISMNEVTGTVGILTYLRFSFGLAELRSFVSTSVNVLAGMKAGNIIPLLFNPRFLHTVSDISNVEAWRPCPPAPHPSKPPPKPQNAYMKVSISQMKVDLIFFSEGAAYEAGAGRVSMIIASQKFCFHVVTEEKTVISWSELNLYSKRRVSDAFMNFGCSVIRMSDSLTSSSIYVEMDHLTVTMHEEMKLGVLMESALHQRDILKMCTSEPSVKIDVPEATVKKPSTSSCSMLVPVTTRARVKTKFLSVKFKEAFRVHFDCTFAKQDVSKFLIVEWEEQLLTLKSTDDVEKDENKVRELDGEPSNSLNRELKYTGLSGGDFTMSCSMFRVRLAPETENYIMSTAVLYSGTLYLASISDPRVAQTHQRVILSDDLGNFRPVFSKELVSSAAPSKLYTNWIQIYGDFAVHLHPSMPLYLNAISKVLTISLPPNDDPTPPLFWWDSYRYWIQGNTTMKFDTFNVVYVVIGATRSVLNLHVSMKKAEMNGTCTYISCEPFCVFSFTFFSAIVLKDMVDIKSTDFSINAEIMEIISKSRKKNNRFLQKLHAMRSQLVSIPRFSLSLVHSRKVAEVAYDGASRNRLKRVFYSHHDVYLNPSQIVPADKFHHFRTRRWSIDWALHIQCSRRSHKSGVVSLFARLDVLLRVVDVIQRPMVTEVGRSGDSDADPESAHKMKIDTMSSIPEPDVSWIFDIVSSINLFLSFDKFLACSWPSERNLQGVVVTQDSLALQMKQFREYEESVFKIRFQEARETSEAAVDAGDSSTEIPTNSLQIQTLKIDIDNLEVYIRDWTRPVRKPYLRHRPLLNPHASLGNKTFESIPHLNGMFESIYKLLHATKLSVSLMSEEDISTLGTNEGKSLTRRASITPHQLLAHQHSYKHHDAYLLPPWMHPWDEYWWGLKEIKSTRFAPIFFASIKQSVSRNTYVQYRCLLAEFQYFGRNNESAKASVIGKTSRGMNNQATSSTPSSSRSASSRATAPLLDHNLGQSYSRSARKTFNPSQPLQRARKDRCLSIINFASNHALTHPPPSTLPSSYFYRSLPVHAVDLAAPRGRNKKCSTVRVNQKIDVGRQIYSLSIVDMRLLWTLGLRNALFGYIAHYHEIADYQKNVHSSQPVQGEISEKQKKQKEVRRRSRTKNNDIELSDEATLHLSASHVDTIKLNRIETQESKFIDDGKLDPLLRSETASIPVKLEESSVLSNLFLNPSSRNRANSTQYKLQNRRNLLKRTDATRHLTAAAENGSVSDDKALLKGGDNDTDLVRRESHLSPYSRQSVSSQRTSLLFRDIEHHSFESPERIFVSEKPIRNSFLQSHGQVDGLSLLRERKSSLSIDHDKSCPSMKLLNDKAEGGVSIRQESPASSMWDSKTQLISMFHSSYPLHDSIAESVLSPSSSGPYMHSPDRECPTRPTSPSKESPNNSTYSQVPSAVATRGKNGKLLDKGRASSIEKLFNRESFGNFSADTSDIRTDVSVQKFSLDSKTPAFADAPLSYPVQESYTEGISKLSSESGKSSLQKKEKTDLARKRYFIVELIDHQVNFLDEKTQSSLIIVAGKSSLEGKKGAYAHLLDFVTDAGPKRENTTQLHMDAVRAYTVSSFLQWEGGSEDDIFFRGEKSLANVVCWKAMDCTETNPLDSHIVSPSKRRDSFLSRLKKKADGSDRLKSKESYLRPPKYDFKGVAVGPGGREKVINDLLLAIADFEIKALYTFHEDVDPEIEKIEIIKSSTEPVTLVMVEIPDLCVDITSAQFYITLNVVTNLLLAAPPKTESSWQKEQEVDEQMDAKKNMRVLTVANIPSIMPEDSAVMENGVKSTSFSMPSDASLAPKTSRKLDINFRKDREDIQRVLDSMTTSGRTGQMDYGLSTHVEYLLGRGVWILRNDSDKNLAASNPRSATVESSSSDVEIGFMGVFGAHTFHDDRYVLLLNPTSFNWSY